MFAGRSPCSGQQPVASTSSSSAKHGVAAGLPSCRQQQLGRRRRSRAALLRAVERDLDWEPRAPSTGPTKGDTRKNYMNDPPPPPPPGARTLPPLPEGPFKSRRDVVLTLLGGAGLMWTLNHKLLAPIDSFGGTPDVPFNLVGYTDLAPQDFIYFKTPGGRWVAAAEDQQGRFFMIDEVGDLYYDSGDPQVGLYAMDTQGNLFNMYVDTDGEQKVTPVGNISDLQQFKISEIAGIKLDREVNVVAFTDGREMLLPPGSSYIDPTTGQIMGPDELVEGYDNAGPQERQLGRRGLFDLFRGKDTPPSLPIDRVEVDFLDRRPLEMQVFEQTLLPDPDTGDIALPPGFDIRELAREVAEEARQKAGQ